MALSAGESFSGGQVRDSKSRSVVISETTNAALSAGEFYSAGFLCDPDSRTVICQDTAHSALVAGETLTGGDVRDKVGRIACAVETLNAPVSAGSQFSDGWLNDSQGRRIIALDTLGAALGAGEQFTSGQIRDSVGRLVLATETAAGSAYDALVLTDTPVGYWPLNEPSGTTAFDKTANANNGTYSGAFALGASALLADGATGCNFTGGQMAVPDAAPLRLGTGNISLECWFNASALTSYNCLFDSGLLPTTRGCSVMLATTTQFFVALAKPPSGGVVNSTTTVTTATRFHFVLTNDGTTVTAYLNGVSAGASPITNIVGASPNSTGIGIAGNPTTGGATWSGQIAKVAVYNTVLSPARVAAHYAAR